MYLRDLMVQILVDKEIRRVETEATTPLVATAQVLW